MKMRWMTLVVTGALNGGCVPTNFVVPPTPPAAAETAAAKSGDPERPAYSPPVIAGQITGANAHEKAEALRAEIEADMVAAVEQNSKKDKK
jgi:hypothetical protein